VLLRLKAGNERYCKNEPGKPPLSLNEKQALTVTQKPLVGLLSCADSRVPVELIFGAGPGDLFIARNAGNVFAPSTAASLDYGVKHLGIKLLVVLGHQCCGAVKAAQLPSDAIAGETPPLASLLADIKKGLGELPQLDEAAAHDRNAVSTNVRVQVAAMAASPVYAAKIAAAELKIVGAFYEMATGTVHFLEADKTVDECVECNAAAAERDASLTPDEVLLRLKAGNERYCKNEPGKPPLSLNEKQALTVTQKPLVGLLSCADSRVPVELIFGAGPGDLFIARNAGNVFAPSTAASLDYGVKHLGIKLLVVLGHQCCGAVKAAQLPSDAIAGETPPLASLLADIKKGLGELPQLDEAAAHDRNAVSTNVRVQVAAMAASPVYAAKIAAAELKIVGAFYEMATGAVHFLE